MIINTKVIEPIIIKPKVGHKISGPKVIKRIG